MPANRNPARLLRDARRDVERMSTTGRRDLEQIQKGLSPTTKANRASVHPARAARAPSRWLAAWCA